MIRLYKPRIEELWFKEKMMNDTDTMKYNHAYGGTIPFPKERWKDWYKAWIADKNPNFYYRYMVNKKNDFIGEVAYHFDEERHIYITDVIVYAPYRRKGYGKEGLLLLCKEARKNNVDVLFDDISIDNSSVLLFIKCGFTEDYRTDEYIMVKKSLI